jgi:DNA polymerase-1
MADIGKEVVLYELEDKKIKGVYLGEWQGREWYWEPIKNEIYWRVPEIRECVAAPPGYVVLAADYAQIEIKLMAFLSQDPTLLKALNARDASGNPTDIHCYIATEVYGQKLNFTYDEIVLIINGKAEGGKNHPRFKELKYLRANIKTTTFGIPYGAGKQTIARQTGLTEDQAQQLIDDFFEKFPVLKKWVELQGDTAIRYGFTYTPYGRKRFYIIPLRSDDNYDAEISQIRRWAGNQPIQSASADMLKDALRRIYSRIRGGVLNGPKLYDARLCLVVHDEIVMICKKEDAKAVKEIMVISMSEAYDNIITSIPNKIDVVEGESWEKV